MSANLLSYEQWVAKHAVKLEGVSTKDRKVRYNQYKTQFLIDGASRKRRAKVKSSGSGKAWTKGGHELRVSPNSFSRCTKLYATALMDPWACSEPPCIPDEISLPSYKVGPTIRGTFSIGTAGVGFILMNGYNLASDTPTVRTTTPTYAAPIVDATLPGTLTANNNSPFVTSQISTNGVQLRLVGAGIKCRYMGSEIQRSGRAVMVRSPVNGALPNGLPPQAYLTYRESNTAPNDRKEHFVCHRPAAALDLSYNALVTSVTTSYQMAIIVEAGTAGAGQVWEYETIQWFEVIGQPTPGFTVSHSDPLGMAATRQSLPLMQPAGSPAEALSQLMGKMASVAGSAFSFVSNAVGGAENILPAISAMLL